MARKKTKTKTKSKTTKQSKKISWVLSKQQKIVLGSFLFLLGLALLFSFISYFFSWQADQSTLSELSDRSVESQNWLNKFGAALGDVFIYQGFGLAAFTLAILVTLSGFYYFFDKPRKKLQGFWFWGIIVMLWFATFLGFFAETNPLLGGMVGFELNDFLQDFIGLIGTILVLAFVAIVYFAIRLKLTPEHIGQFFAKRKQAIASEFNRSDDEGNEFVDTAFDKDNIELPQEEVEETPEEPQLKTTPTPTETPVKQETETKETPKATEDDDFEIEIEETVEEEEVVENLSTKLVQDFGEFDPTLELSNYRFPTIELLKDYTKGQSITVDQEELEENKNRIVDTLKNYKIDIAHIKATVGPTVTLYEIVPEAGVRISKIKNLEDDIALSLAALGIRIIAPIPGKGTIGIEVPNKNARIVSMR
ncbi:MAG TPA: cell division protein FtsK, partial [Leeuwenhoekiella sp.]|nr:cell division protein FtsK [Leeuwenhoekiella sp.]